MSPNPARPLHLVPSILSADFACLERDLAAARAAGARRFQVDIMDGHFVPNISMGPMFVQTTRRLIPKDVPQDGAADPVQIEAHLMVERPEQWVEPCVRAGADLVIVHAEATVHLHSLLARIRALGAHPAVALNPDSPLSWIEEALDQLDLVLCMTVEPGFGGQAFIPSVLPKIARLRKMLDARGLPCEIEVDGGVDASTIARARDAGANVFVAGSSVFSHPQGAGAGLDTLQAALAG